MDNNNTSSSPPASAAWSLDRAQRIAEDLKAVSVDAWAETWHDPEADAEDIHLSIHAPLKVGDPIWTVTVWHDRETWRVDTGSADQSNAFGVRSLDDLDAPTDSQLVGLLLAEASAAWEVYDPQ